MNIESLTTLLNTIRDNASESYSNRVPSATQTNLGDVAGVLLSDSSLANEFTSSLMNKVALSVVHARLFTNPLAILKKGMKPLGDSVEEIFINYAKASAYDSTGASLLTRALPDVKTIYHKMNRKDKYKVTISREMLTKAFTSYTTLGTFITGILNSLYNGASLDEFVIYKELIKKAIEKGAMKVIAIDEPTTNSTNATAFIKAVKTVSSNMQFPSDQFNGYLQVQNTDIVPVITFTPVNEQIIVIDSATNVSIDVDVLANAFNMSKQEFLAKRIVIDTFPIPEVRACLMDINFTQIYDDLFEVESFRNGEGLYDNYYIHVWQTVSYSSLVNAVAFMVGSDQTDAGTTVDEFSVTYTLMEGASSTNTVTNVLEGTSYKTTLTVPTGADVTVTMGGTDVTSTRYSASTKKVSIPAVTGNIVIEVAAGE